MPKEFRLPDIGEGLTDAEIVAWHIGVGDTVVADQPLVDVETAKAVVEITSPFSGTVLFLGGAQGSTVEVGEILFVIGGPDEVWEPAPSGEAPRPHRLEPSDGLTASPAGATAQVRAVPVVRKLAREHGIDLATIDGSGPGGAITRDDVQGAISRQPSAGAGERVTMSRLRRTIAENMTRSWQQIPHVTVQAEVDATQLLGARRSLTADSGTPIVFEALIGRAVLPLLTEFPEFNATLDGADLILRHSRDLGFAVDTDDGLLVIVVPDTDDLDAVELSRRIVELASRAKARKATTEELSGQTFTISNIGALGGGHGTPIIPFGTTAILSCGMVQDQAIVRDGEILSAPIMPIDLSYDHRVIDGGLGQRFLAALVSNLEYRTR